MALLGLRDISSLATPPIDRRSIVTQVRQKERHLIRDAILRENALRLLGLASDTP